MTEPTAQLRHLDIFDPREHASTNVDIIGVGGIGSFTAHALTRLGIQNIDLYDPDVVAPHNVGVQLYSHNDIGDLKVDATAQHLTHINPDLSCHAIPETVPDTRKPARRAIRIAAVDSMRARSAIFDSAIKFDPTCDLYIDARIAGELIHVHAFSPTNPSHVDTYRTSLYSDDEAIQATCTAQNIIDVGYVVAAAITRLTRAHLAGDHLFVDGDGNQPHFIEINQRTLTTRLLSYDTDHVTFS